jgi:hypothetical protein
MLYGFRVSPPSLGALRFVSFVEIGLRMPPLSFRIQTNAAQLSQSFDNSRRFPQGSVT